MWPWWRTWVAGNQPPARPFMERTKRSSPTRTTQMVLGLRKVPSRRREAISQLGCGPDPGELVTGPSGHGVSLGYVWEAGSRAGHAWSEAWAVSGWSRVAAQLARKSSASWEAEPGSAV